MNVNNGLIFPHFGRSGFPDLLPPDSDFKVVHTQYSGWSDLRMSKQLANDFKVFEDPKTPGFVTLNHLEKMVKDHNIPKESRDFAKELMGRETLLDQLDSDSKKWLDGKISEQSIQDSIAAQTQARQDKEAPAPRPRSPYDGTDFLPAF